VIVEKDKKGLGKKTLKDAPYRVKRKRKKNNLNL